jgi:DNA repair exonuclease SbcCD ATPase subunit
MCLNLNRAAAHVTAIALMVALSGCFMSSQEHQAEQAEAAASHAQESAARAEEAAAKALVAAQQASVAADKAAAAVEEATKALDRASDRLEQLREQQEALHARKHRGKPLAHAAASPATSPEPVAKAITDSPPPAASPSPAK